MNPRLPCLALATAVVLAAAAFAADGPAASPPAAKKDGETARRDSPAPPELSPAKIRERQDKAAELAKAQVAALKKARDILERKPKRNELEESELQALLLAQQYYTAYGDCLQVRRDLETLQAGGEAGARARRPAAPKREHPPTAAEEAQEGQAAARDTLAKLKELNDKYWAAAKAQEQAADKYRTLRGEDLPDPMLWLLEKPGGQARLDLQPEGGKADGKSGNRPETAP